METRIPITRTKVLVPKRRSDLLSRRRLLDLLYEFIDLKLVIVAAPAGYGKTSLLVDFISFKKTANDEHIPACWLALDSLDQDPIRFIAHFIAAIAQRFPGFGRLSGTALRSANPDALDLDALTSILINDVYENIDENFMVVLDDYHLVEDSKVVTYFINQFIQLSDENCHLVICSRTLLNLPDMPLLVARSQVGGLSFEALAFNPNEIRYLWSQNFHAEISLAEAEDLSRQTEGWITGVLLTQQVSGGQVAERLQRARVAGVGLYDYLAQQVLDRQPPEVQRFLLRTALLDEFDASLCAEVIGTALNLEADWDELVVTILRLNLFIQQVGEDQIWLRYHHLFRDFLVDRMQRAYPEEARRIELAQAPAWIRRGEWERAYEIFKQSGDLGKMARLVEQAGPSLISRGRLSTLNQWLEALPLSERASSPALLSLQGSLAAMRGATEEGLQLLDQAVQLYHSASDPEALALALVRRSTARRFQGHYSQALEDARQAYQIALEAGSPTTAAYALDNQGILLYHLGDLQQARERLESAQQAYLELGDEEAAAKDALHLGMVAKALGQYDLAESSYNQALEHYERSGNRVWQANLLNNLGVLQHQKGSYVVAASSFERALAYAQNGSYTRLEAYTLASIGDLYRDAGALEEAREAYRQARPISLRINERFLLFYLDLAEAILSGLENRPEKAQHLLELAWQSAERSASPYQQNLVRMERGVIACRRELYLEGLPDLREAAAYFERAGHRGELLRAHFFLSAACQAAGQIAESRAHLEKVHAAFNDPTNENTITLAGRELVEFLRTSGPGDAPEDILLRHILAFEKKLPGLRRQLRRQTQTVPLGMPSIVIQSLGRTQVRVNDKTITSAEWVTQSSRDLFLMLVAHPEGLTKEEAGVILWPDCSVDELRWRFKNTIYRLRRAAGKETILFEGDLYRFNHSIDFDNDAETFEHMLELGAASTDPAQRLYHYEAAARLYRGDFLPDLSADWVLNRRARLREQYLDGLMALSQLYNEQKLLEKAMSTVERILGEDRSLEAAYQLGMQILAASANRTALKRLYERCERALSEELGVKPSRATRLLFESLYQLK